MLTVQSHACSTWRSRSAPRCSSITWAPERRRPCSGAPHTWATFCCGCFLHKPLRICPCAKRWGDPCCCLDTWITKNTQRCLLFLLWQYNVNFSWGSSRWGLNWLYSFKWNTNEEKCTFSDGTFELAQSNTWPSFTYCVWEMNICFPSKCLIDIIALVTSLLPASLWLWLSRSFYWNIHMLHRLLYLVSVCITTAAYCLIILQTFLFFYQQTLTITTECVELRYEERKNEKVSTGDV